MVTQKPISARINTTTLAVIDQEVFVSGTSRNRILNEGGLLYCQLQDLRRRLRCYQVGDREACLEQFFRRFIPELARWDNAGSSERSKI